MIRVGYQKPTLTFVAAHNDMSHFTPSHYTTNDYFYMGLMDYMEKKQFDSFDMKRIAIEEEALKSGDLGAILASAMGTLAGQEMKRLIDKAHGQLWQFNAVSSDLTGYVRQVVALGENQLTTWTWFDANVKIPYLKLKARALNFLMADQVEREWLEWNKFLDKVYKKAK